MNMPDGNLPDGNLPDGNLPDGSPVNDNSTDPTSTQGEVTGLAASEAAYSQDEPHKRAVVLLSGGLDSATTLAIARQRGLQTLAISFRYGQRHEQEIEAAQAIASQMGVTRHAIVDIDLAQFGGSALTSQLAVPKHASAEEISGEIPVTYVPARNTVFLALALAWAEVNHAEQIFIGVNAVDYSGYPDCRPEFIQAFQDLANLATKAAVTRQAPVTVETPLIELTKAQIIARGVSLGVDYGLTRSCYDPTPAGLACGHCDACLLRLRGFAENGLEDPIAYAS